MKTAMQELIEYLNGDTYAGICDIKDRAEELIEKEKEQIEIAFDLARDEVTSVFIIDGEDYYNKKFNQNK
jgi:DNA polymerase II small subunit/DNA polymerase delta subunit B